MPLRILTYTSLLWENLVRQGLVKRGNKLPPVFPIVIYNGEREWTTPLNIRDMIISLDDRLSYYHPSQKYFLIDENKVESILLENAEGEAAYIFRLEQAKSAEEILVIAHEFAKRLSEPKFDFLRQAVYSWISCLLSRKEVGDAEQQSGKVENFAMLEQRIAQWEQEFIQKGIHIGEERGMQKGISMMIANQRNMLLEMLSDRFGVVPNEWRNAIGLIEDQATINNLIREIYRVKDAAMFNELLNRRN